MRRSSCRSTTARPWPRHLPSTSSPRCSPSRIPANMGLVPPVEGFLELLRHKADDSGALLIFDEVITGFRVAAGGAQEREGIAGRHHGHGQDHRRRLPAAAYGGSRALMDRIAPAGDVYQAGTLSGNPLAVAAGLTTLRDARRRGYIRPRRHDRDARRRPCATRRPQPASRVAVNSVPGLLTIFFAETAPRDYAGARACDHEALRRVLSRAAGPRRLPAGVAVRGVVPVAGPHLRAPRPHAGCRQRGLCRAVVILDRLADVVRQDGGLLADALHATITGETPHGDAVARGPRADGHAADLPLVIEAIREGYLLHYGGVGGSRIMSGEDDDLALLAGDRLYALGLERLAAAGDPRRRARPWPTSSPSRPRRRRPVDAPLADAVWAAGCAEVGWGPERRPRGGQSRCTCGRNGRGRAPRSSRAPTSPEAWRRTTDRVAGAGGAARTMTER